VWRESINPDTNTIFWYLLNIRKFYKIKEIKIPEMFLLKKQIENPNKSSSCIAKRIKSVQHTKSKKRFRENKKGESDVSFFFGRGVGYIVGYSEDPVSSHSAKWM
jgi:hypothetical protein